MKKIYSIFAIILPVLFWSGSLFASFSQAPDTLGCQAQFVADVNPSDLLTVSFQDFSYSEDNITSWDWAFGDGATSTEQNPMHTYAQEGAYDVSLLITSASCTSLVDITLYLTGSIDSSGCNCPIDFDLVCVQTPNGGIIEFPNECLAICAGYTLNDLVDCVIDTSSYCQAGADYTVNGLAVSFTDFSAATGSITGWSWDFGDGNSSTEQNPTHTYATDGYYNVLFTIETADDCSSTQELLVEFSDCNCPTVFDPVCVEQNGLVIPFTNECEAVCAGFTANDFVDCAIDSIGDCQAVYTTTISGLTVSFIDMSYSNVNSWSWDFGDGSTSTDQNPFHTYTDAGTYDVVLTIETGDGCSSTTETQFTLVDCNCSTDYDPVCVQDSFFCGNGGVLEFSNACMALCAGYTADDFVDCTIDTTEFCSAYFGYELDLTNQLSVSFVDYSYTMSNDVTWAWDFGDGTTSTEQNPIHTYTENGIYLTTLTISTPNCASTFTLEVWLEDTTNPCVCTDVYAPVCVQLDSLVLPFWNACEAECAGFTADDFVDCDTFQQADCDANFGYYQDIFSGELNVQFEDYSYTNNPITNWAWDFGDGTSSTEQNPTHTYAEAGEYVVTLVIETDDCSSSTVMDVFVGDFTIPECQAFFWLFPADTANELSYQFLDFSFGNPTSWAWDFGDGTTSTEQNPTHTYTASGAYTIMLTITVANCESTFELVMDSDDYLMVSNGPSTSGIQALFTPLMDDESNSVYFKNQSTSSSPITNITYDFGDGTKANASNIQHLFLEKKAYNVTMQVTNSLGETSSFMGTIDLNSKQFKASTSGTSIILGNNEINNTTFALQLAPNPVNTELSITFDATVAGKYNISIQTVTGKTIYTHTLDGTKGQNKTSVDVQAFPQGMYLLKLQFEDAVQTYKFVKE